MTNANNAAHTDKLVLAIQDRAGSLQTIQGDRDDVVRYLTGTVPCHAPSGASLEQALPAHVEWLRAVQAHIAQAVQGCEEMLQAMNAEPSNVIPFPAVRAVAAARD